MGADAPVAELKEKDEKILKQSIQAEQIAKGNSIVKSPVSRPGFQRIFDGKTLKGWHKNPQPIGHGTGGQWTVENGAIIGQQDPPGSGNGGILLSDQTYQNVEIYFQVKIEWGCDSGLFLRSNEKGQCLQVMIDYHDNGNIGQIVREGFDGKAFRTYRLDADYKEENGRREMKGVKVTPIEDQPGLGKPPFDPPDWNKIWKAGEWNQLHVKIEGNPPTITTWLNGVKMTTYTNDHNFEKELAGAGHLALQVHGGAGLWPKGSKIQFRDIQVRELKQAP
jgi:hypothetical protein